MWLKRGSKPNVKEEEQEGVVSVQVSEQESEEIGRGSDEQLLVTEQN